jgi:hypothetical protein
MQKPKENPKVREGGKADDINKKRDSWHGRKLTLGRALREK